MDAVDCALVELDGPMPRLIATSRTAWPDTLSERIRVLAAGAPIDATSFAMLDTEVGEFLADATGQLLRAHAIPPGRVAAIGCHGQTVAHVPEGDPATTLQLGDANVIAERTGIVTVNDFRRRDMAAGGQGAPLAPAFHDAVLRDAAEERVILNLGGIANVTILPDDHGRAVTGFDTGPANCLMDAWAREHLGQAYDRDGEWAASASADPALLARMLGDPFFAQQPPKSTGTQHFSANWLAVMLAAAGTLTPAEVQATLLALTVQTIADAIRRHAPAAKRILVCGGGVHNLTLMAQLAGRLALPVESTAGYGVDPDWMEAMAFAWLAQRALANEPGNLPSVTGARCARVLGAVHPA